MFIDIDVLKSQVKTSLKEPKLFQKAKKEIKKKDDQEKSNHDLAFLLNFLIYFNKT
jgi:hypothetical protein